MALPIKRFTMQELLAIFRDDTPSGIRKKAIDKHEDFLPHSDGAKPIKIIDKQRPNEPDVVKQFRLDIWEPITKPSFDRIISSLSKIRRSSDWSVLYPTEEFSKIREGFTLEDYCETNYPYFTSITNWVFSVLLKQYLTDANAVVLVKPLYIEGVEQTDYYEPFAYIYNSCHVVDFKDQQYAIIKIEEGCTYRIRGGKSMSGKSYYVVTAELIERYDQSDEKGNYIINESESFFHNLQFLPAFQLGGIICKSAHGRFLYESRINGILPNLNEAAAEYTDLQAGKRLHIYPERWEFTQHECPACRGVGMLPNPNWKEGDSIQNSQIKCNKCTNGYIPSGPYSKMLIRPADLGTQSIPTPPAGFIEKDIEIIKLMDQSVDKNIYKALSAINFQFLERVPLSESGIAKEVDKDELNNTVHSIAEDIVSVMDNVYKCTAHYRYNKLYSIEEIKRMLPKIPVPEHYDLISSQYMQEEIKRARDAKMGGLIVSQMEVEFTGKRFSMDDEINSITKLSYKLDPLPGITVEEKMIMASNRTITKDNNIISDNLVSFIRRAIFENEDFDTWPLDKQKELLLSYAIEQKELMDEAAKLAAAALAGGEESEVEPVVEEEIEPVIE